VGNPPTEGPTPGAPKNGGGKKGVQTPRVGGFQKPSFGGGIGVGGGGEQKKTFWGGSQQKAKPPGLGGGVPPPEVWGVGGGKPKKKLFV